MSARTGGCLCGAVRFEATEVPETFGACHCEMCRRWTGSALLGVTVPLESVTWEGADSIGRLQSSDWAERAFCSRCGSPLYYHVTAEGPMAENLEMPIGLFDDPSGFVFTNEIYIDNKPDSFAYAGDRTRLTRKETLAKFGIAEGDLQ
ncbi:GFA family protein [Silicimonas algicola]|uniref:CENP-V/GFA domain-containing protein n=1 Tax=Silicimonas algicola TaxID=1826607 RepID=A0A316GNC5_9RHOB|nr:GFA family protein [Silicimonas algicola]AZQ69364.1 GFA family protein [Silicimonas algicola]PWK56427.1 hypothetical protein C8D95_10498 [Silicimonas algicola]